MLAYARTDAHYLVSLAAWLHRQLAEADERLGTSGASSILEALRLTQAVTMQCYAELSQEVTTQTSQSCFLTEGHSSTTMLPARKWGCFDILMRITGSNFGGSGGGHAANGAKAAAGQGAKSGSPPCRQSGCAVQVAR